MTVKSFVFKDFEHDFNFVLIQGFQLVEILDVLMSKLLRKNNFDKVFDSLF